MGPANLNRGDLQRLVGYVQQRELSFDELSTSSGLNEAANALQVPAQSLHRLVDGIDPQRMPQIEGTSPGARSPQGQRRLATIRTINLLAAEFTSLNTRPIATSADAHVALGDVIAQTPLTQDPLLSRVLDRLTDPKLAAAESSVSGSRDDQRILLHLVGPDLPLWRTSVEASQTRLGGAEQLSLRVDERGLFPDAPRSQLFLQRLSDGRWLERRFDTRGTWGECTISRLDAEGSRAVLRQVRGLSSTTPETMLQALEASVLRGSSEV